MSSNTTVAPHSTHPLPSHISVLVLDDQRFDRHKLNRLCADLPMQCEVTQTDSLAGLNTQLVSAAFDLIFVDYDLPDGTGIDALDMIQLSQRNCHAASIMVTSYDEESVALEAMSRGCSDYITKDELSPSSLERAVTNALQKSVLHTQVQAQTFARAEVDNVLQRFATQCATDIKPMVSRMMRQLRDLREAPANDTELTLSRRENVETSCMHLWEFLEDLEKYQASMILKDMGIKPEQIALTPAVAEVAKSPPAHTPIRPKRPPSPFSRPAH